MNINKRIKQSRISDLRLDNDLKQKEIAKKLNVLENNYSKWERGITDIPLIKSNELANIYKCSLDYLFGLNDNNIKSLRTSLNLQLLSKRLFELRKERHLTQEQLSKAIGFTQKTYSNYETGNRIPTSFKLYYIAVYYNVSLDYLVGRTDNMKIN